MQIELEKRRKTILDGRHPHSTRSPKLPKSSTRQTQFLFSTVLDRKRMERPYL